MPALAFRDAREHGIPVDETLAHADAVKSFGYYDKLDSAVQYTHIIDPAMDDGYHLLAANAVGVRPSLVTALYARHIAAHQKPDGRWVTGDTRPPQSYSPFTATAISLHAIQLYGHPSLAADTEARVKHASAWLAANAAHTTEGRTYQLLGMAWAGADRSSLGRLAQELKATQQTDGGWNSRDGRASDAYSTGEALVALHDAAGISPSDAVWQRGLQYLLSTQAADGSWHVESRLRPPAPVSPPYLETGYPYGDDQFISTTGASLAVMALARALGPARKLTTAVLTEATPENVEPWAETVLFGSPADVRALLDKGFDPNSLTQGGGTTALMLAMPDLEKAKLLIERGANVNGRSKSKFSPLMVAANYPGSTATMRLLLDRGAQVRLPKSQGAPMFNASPFFLAAMAGNIAMLRPLREAGDDPNSKMNLIGMFPSTPLLGVTTWGDAVLVRGLLDCGATVDQADDDGITPLGWAAIGNQPEVARILIEHGADVNHVDKKGMTPLLYAASIDFGSSTMIDLMVKAGANLAARNPEGLTALELANKYKHTHLVSSLTKTSN
ncbi:MAG: ankyrin repeat domain-containing protein [Acidobacteriota bacterium]|nr:ankyrin repeat domain-containing protein [Acidobacteriota bacterium]